MRDMDLKIIAELDTILPVEESVEVESTPEPEVTTTRTVRRKSK